MMSLTVFIHRYVEINLVNEIYTKVSTKTKKLRSAKSFSTRRFSNLWKCFRNQRKSAKFCRGKSENGNVKTVSEILIVICGNA